MSLKTNRLRAYFHHQAVQPMGSILTYESLQVIVSGAGGNDLFVPPPLRVEKYHHINLEIHSGF
jgi:hypothetical protein